MKRVVSVSLGSSKRDKVSEVEILGLSYRLERQGTDGDLAKFRAKFLELDGKVDALGIGGYDLYFVIEDRKYKVHQIANLIAGVRKTPVVDGSGLKHTLERETIERLQTDGEIDFRRKRVLMVSAVDRFGMAQALVKAGAQTTFGDLIFGLGLPIPIRSYAAVRRLGKLLLPIITRLPAQWFYPTGEKQETRTPKHAKVFADAEIVCGDWHFIRRYMPDDMRGKVVITQTLRALDIELLKQVGVERAYTTTPIIGGETFATNVMEGVIVSYVGKPVDRMLESDYLETLTKLGWKPNRIDLHRSEADSA